MINPNLGAPGTKLKVFGNNPKILCHSVCSTNFIKLSDIILMCGFVAKWREISSEKFRG